DEAADLQRTRGFRQLERRVVRDKKQRLRKPLRLGAPRFDLLAGPAPKDDRLLKAAPRPGRRILEAGKVFDRLQDGGRIELVGREVLAFPRPAIGEPSPGRAKSGDGEPLRQVLGVIPGVEFLVHGGRWLRHGEEEAAARHGGRTWPFISSMATDQCESLPAR